MCALVFAAAGLTAMARLYALPPKVIERAKQSLIYKPPAR
jgi:hypothetical protein